MKFLKKSIGLVVLSIMVVLAFSTPVYAIDHSGHYSINPWVGWGSHVSHVEWWYSQEGTINFHDVVDTAAYCWNNTLTPIFMCEVYNQGDSVLRVNSKDYGNTGWYGQQIPHIGYGNIKLNEYYTLTDNEWAEVASHEMGHAHGLNHYACSSEIMVASGFIGTPQPYTGDIAGINAKY